jgi:mannose-6-phosphate isomerase-like protein (cupin superfamily)
MTSMTPMTRTATFRARDGRRAQLAERLEHLDAVQTGLTHYRLRSGRRQGWAHRHGVAEEIYVALSGSGRIKVDEELFELRSLDAIRVAPASARELEAGPNGLEVLAFGSHSPGDGELVADWWTT